MSEWINMPGDIREILSTVRIIQANQEKMMTDQADFTADTAALTTFFEVTLPAAEVAIQALQAQGITNLGPLDDLVSQIPAAAASLAVLAPPATSSTSSSSSTPGDTPPATSSTSSSSSTPGDTPPE